MNFCLKYYLYVSAKTLSTINYFDLVLILFRSGCNLPLELFSFIALLLSSFSFILWVTNVYCNASQSHFNLVLAPSDQCG